MQSLTSQSTHWTTDWFKVRRTGRLWCYQYLLIVSITSVLSFSVCWLSTGIGQQFGLVLHANTVDGGWGFVQVAVLIKKDIRHTPSPDTVMKPIQCSTSIDILSQVWTALIHHQCLLSWNRAEENLDLHFTITHFVCLDVFFLGPGFENTSTGAPRPKKRKHLATATQPANHLRSAPPSHVVTWALVGYMGEHHQSDAEGFSLDCSCR